MVRWRRLAIGLPSVVLLAAAEGDAQELSFFGGGAHARYADSLSGTAGIGSVRLRAGDGLRAMNLQAGLSQFATGEWAAQLDAQGAALFRVTPGLALGLVAGGTFSDFELGAWSGTAAAGPMVGMRAADVLVMLGASAGAVRSVDGFDRAVGTGTFRLRYAAPGGLWLDAGVLGTVAEGSIRYADATAGVTYTGRRVLLAAVAGARTGDLANDPWGQVRLEVAATRFLRVEASAGTYPRDLVGFTEGLFVQAGVRLATGGRTDGRPRPAARPVVVRPFDAARVEVTVRYAGAVRRLAIAGDFSNWEPIPLRASGNGEWTVEIALEHGIHRYALVADGVWVLPDGVAGVDDGLGGRVGVLAVPHR